MSDSRDDKARQAKIEAASKAAVAPTKRTEAEIAALLRERAHYVAHGLDDRVAQVDEQLKLRGHKLEVPQGRTAKPRQKAD